MVMSPPPLKIENLAVVSGLHSTIRSKSGLPEATVEVFVIVTVGVSVMVLLGALKMPNPLVGVLEGVRVTVGVAVFVDVFAGLATTVVGLATGVSVEAAVVASGAEVSVAAGGFSSCCVGGGGSVGTTAGGSVGTSAGGFCCCWPGSG